MSPAVQESPLEKLEPPARLHVPLGMGAAEENWSDLPVGRAVFKGEALLRVRPEGGPAALAPTSGRIVGHSLVTLTSGQSAAAVELEVDFQDRTAPETAHGPLHAEQHREQLLTLLEHPAPEHLGLLIDRLRDGGVWADRNSSPNLLAQLHLALKRPVDTVLISAVDHDPRLKIQATVASRMSAMIVSVAGMLGSVLGAKNTWIAVEAASEEKWWQPLRREMRKSSVEIVSVRADYPRADPNLLVHDLLGRRLRPGKLPVEAGVIILDAPAAVALGRAILRRQPMLRAAVAIRDHLRGISSYMAVPVGTPTRHILEHLEIVPADLTILAGDLLRDCAISADAIIAGEELCLHILPPRLGIIPDPCIRCGWCAMACPTRVHPAAVLEAAQRQDLDLAESAGIGACIECGICSFVCPSRLPLLDGIRAVRRLGGI